MSSPLAIAHRSAKRLRRRLHAIAMRAEAIRRTRNLIARDLLAPHGPFRPKTRPSRRKPKRHPKHRERFLAEVMA